ncbi:hypothetical protein NMG60_11033428 [Bertholletia excelsa]
MSADRPSAGNPNSPSRFTGDGDYVCSDPLLDPEAFIDAEFDDAAQTPTKSQTPQDGAIPGPPASGESELPATPAAEAANFTNEMRKSADNGPESSRSGTTMPERPKWLPDDWRMEFRVRSSGVTAGSVDRYYVEPVSGSRFRSKNEVEYFLQTGSKRKKKPSSDADSNASGESPGGRRQKKSASKSKSTPSLNFDFNNVAEKVHWVLTDATRDEWTPFVDEKMVTKSTRQDWNAAFQLSCT